MNKLWSDIAWDEYLYWQQTDKKMVKKINELIKDIERNGLNQGTGHPEPLKYRKGWSRHRQLLSLFFCNKIGEGKRSRHTNA